MRSLQNVLAEQQIVNCELRKNLSKVTQLCKDLELRVYETDEMYHDQVEALQDQVDDMRFLLQQCQGFLLDLGEFNVMMDDNRSVVQALSIVVDIYGLDLVYYDNDLDTRKRLHDLVTSLGAVLNTGNQADTQPLRGEGETGGETG